MLCEHLTGNTNYATKICARTLQAISVYICLSCSHVRHCSHLARHFAYVLYTNMDNIQINMPPCMSHLCHHHHRQHSAHFETSLRTPAQCRVSLNERSRTRARAQLQMIYAFIVHVGNKCCVCFASSVCGGTSSCAKVMLRRAYYAKHGAEQDQEICV